MCVKTLYSGGTACGSRPGAVPASGRDADADGRGRRVRVPGRRVRVPGRGVRVPDAASASPGRLPGRGASSRSGRGTRTRTSVPATGTPTRTPGRSGRAGCADQASAFTEYETSEMTPPLLLLSMLVGVNSLSLLSPRAHAAAMAPPLLTRHTTPSLRLLRPPRLCMASVPPASEGSPEVGLPLSMTRVQLKYFVLLLLVLQNSVVALVTQATRMKTGVMYSGTAAVLASEVLKMPVCLALIARDVGVAGVRRELHQKVVEPWRDTLTMAVPALCYCLQNALFFVALSNLSAASYQLWSQSKTLSTALFFVLLLGKRLRKRQWFALVLLTAGVALVQYADTGTALRVGRPLVGILAVLASSLLSGFSNVYLEKRIKLGDSSGSGRTVRRAILNRSSRDAVVTAAERARAAACAGFYLDPKCTARPLFDSAECGAMPRRSRCRHERGHRRALCRLLAGCVERCWPEGLWRTARRRRREVRRQHSQNVRRRALEPECPLLGSQTSHRTNSATGMRPRFRSG